MEDRIALAIKDLKSGKMSIITDDKTRENEGDLMIAAEKITEYAISFMAKKGLRLIYLSITNELAKEFNINLMTEGNQESMRTAFTTRIDAKEVITSGISSANRAHTILTFVKENPESLVKPGVFPLIAREGGLFERRGHTEAGIEMTKMAGLFPAKVICEIIDDHGRMLREKKLESFVEEHKLNLISLEEILEYLCLN